MKKFLVFLLLAGCVTASDIDQKVRSWMGIDADELVGVWGAPQGNYQRRDGARILSFESSSVVTTGPGAFAQTFSRHCQVHFVVDAANKIVDASWSGAVDQCDKVVLARTVGEI